MFLYCNAKDAELIQPPSLWVCLFSAPVLSSVMGCCDTTLLSSCRTLFDICGRSSSLHWLSWKHIGISWEFATQSVFFFQSAVALCWATDVQHHKQRGEFKENLIFLFWVGVSIFFFFINCSLGTNYQRWSLMVGFSYNVQSDAIIQQHWCRHHPHRHQ